MKTDFINSRDEIYLVCTEKKANFLFILYITRAFSNIHKAGGEYAKTKFFENTKNFGTTLCLTF